MKNAGSPQTETEALNSAQGLREAIIAHDEGILKSLEICFPACVYSYDRSTHTAEVMPLVQQGFFQGEYAYINSRQPFRVSVRNIQCGGFTIDYPVYVGDTGWVFSSDRDTVLLKQTGALTNSVLEKDRPTAIVEDDYQQKPNTPTLHSFVHGFFIPDNWGAWETHRYKDSMGVALGSALYIGSSIDTDDHRNDSGKKEFQKGDGYEKKTTSSIVLNRGGGVTVASSSDKETNLNAQMTVEKSSVAVEANDIRKSCSSAMIVDATSGIIIRQDIEKGKKWEEKIKKEDGTEEIIKHENEHMQHFICSIQPGKFNLRLIDDEKMLNLSFEDGKLNVSTSGDMNMRVGGDTSFRCEGNVNVTGEKDMNVHAEGNINARASKDAYVSSTNARIVAEESASVAARKVSVAAAETANVNAGKTVNIGSTETTNINAGQKVNLAAGNDINITAPDTVNIVTAKNATVMAKKKGAKVLVTTLSKDSTIDVVAKGAGSKMNVTFEKKESSVNLTMQEEKSTVDIVTQKGDSPISMTTNGDKSDITLYAAKSRVFVKAKENVEIESITSDVNVKAKRDVNITAVKDVNVNATANVNLNAVSNIKASAGANVDIKAGGEANISASRVNINGETRVNGKILTPSVHGPDDSIKYWAHD